MYFKKISTYWVVVLTWYTSKKCWTLFIHNNYDKQTCAINIYLNVENRISITENWNIWPKLFNIFDMHKKAWQLFSVSDKYRIQKMQSLPLNCPNEYFSSKSGSFSWIILSKKHHKLCFQVKLSPFFHWCNILCFSRYINVVQSVWSQIALR